MRRALGAGLAALMVGIGGAAGMVPAAAAEPARSTPAMLPASIGNQPATDTNPLVPDECGINITVVLDASGSIGRNNDRVRDAARTFLDALKDTGSSGRVVDFASTARETAPMTLITSGSLTGNGVHDQALNRYYEFGSSGGAGPSGQHRSYRSGDPTSERSYGRQSSGSPQYTNWQEALEQSAGSATNLVVFITDGDPTAVTSNGRSNGSMPEPFPGSDVKLIGTRGQFEKYALYKAINASNGLKAGGNGPRVLAIGVGAALQNSGSQQRLKDISGPDVYTGVGDFDLNRDDVALVRSFDDLAQALRKVATELCSPSVTITKLAQSAGDAQYSAAQGWDMTVLPTVPSGTYTWTQPDRGDPPGAKTVSTNANGQAQFQWEPTGRITSTAAVSEAGKQGWNFDRAECRRLDEGIPSNQPPFSNGIATFNQADFNIPVGPDSIVSCKYYNSFDYQPGIQITKAAVDDPVRGNAAGWNETYRFEVTNTGNTPLSQVTPTDPQCQSITGPTGDTNGDARLDIGETWTYVCTSFIQRQTTDQALSQTNTVTVTGVDPPGTLVTDTATVTVGIKTPAIAIQKSAKRPDGTPINDGDQVPAGSSVTYEYRVTNPGNDVLQSITVTDDKCSPVTRTSGSGTTLAPGDEWVYSCTTRLQPPSSEAVVTNTGTVTANWSGWTPTGQNNTPVTDNSRKTIGVKKSASLTVVKATNPGSVSQSFDFTLAGSGVATADQSFSLNPGDPASPVPSRTVVVEPAGGSSNYTVTETGDGGTPGPAGWVLTSLTCVDAAGDPVGTTSTATGVATIPLAVGDAVTCTYIDQRLPRLSVVKLAQGDAAGVDFGFTASRPGPLPPISPNAFTLQSGGSQAYTDLPVGPVTITESSIPAGWALNQVSCGTHPVSVAGSAATLDLAYGDDVTCFFANAELAPATLTVAKKGTAVATSPDFDFTASGIGLVTPGVAGSTNFSLAIGETQDVTVRPAAGGTTYTVGEALPSVGPGESGWTRTSIRCVLDSDPDNPVNGNLATGEVDIALAPGQHATCTYVNEQLPRLTIRKSVSVAAGQSGADQTFDFTGTGPGISPATLGNNESQGYPNLTPGSAVTVTETSLAGWTLTGLGCSGPGSARLTTDRAAGQISGSLQLGDDVTCTYANTKNPSQPATLTIIKQVEPAGSAPEFGYTLSGTRVPSGDQSFGLTPGATGSASRVVTLVPDDAGSTYTLTEGSQPAGWDFSSLACLVNGASSGAVSGSEVELSLQPGDAASCTFVNKPKAALTIAKKVSVATGQTGGDTEFDFTTSGLGGATPTLGDGETQAFSDLTASTAVSVTETTLAGWSTTISCTGTGADHYTVSGSTVSGTTESGDDVTCTYVNTKDPTDGATLTVVKKVSPIGPEVPFGFGLTANNPDPATGPFTLQPSADGTASQTFSLSPFEGGTTYTVEEAAPTGWELTSLACTINGVSAGTIDLSAGTAELPLSPDDAATCTFVNRPLAKVTVVKQVSVATGQSGADQTFDFIQTGLSPFGPLGDGESQAFTGLATGTDITIDESVVAGWSKQVACTGPGSDRVTVAGTQVSVADLQAGEDITCTYVNTKDPLVPALLAVGKLADPAAGAPDFTFTAAGTGLTQVGQPGQTQFALTHDEVELLTVHPVEAGNDYTITEQAQAGWERAFIVCADSADPDTIITGNLATGAVTVPDLLPGQVAFCLFGNQVPGQLTVAKHTNSSTSTEFTFTADRDPTTFALGDGDTQAFTGLQPGTTVQITESVPGGPSAVPERWTLVDIVCHGSAVSPTIDLAAARVSVEVGAGEDVVCTYSDAKVQPATITVTKSASPADGESFAFTAAGSDGGVLPADQSFSLAPDGAPASRTFQVYPGLTGETYTLTEVLSGGQVFDWNLDSITCRRDGSEVGTVSGAAVEVDLQPGQKVSCSFANRESASLTVVKSAPENPDLYFPFTWSIDQDGFDLSDQGLVSAFPIDAGSYWVAESTSDPAFPANWLLADGSPVCTGTAIPPDYSRAGGVDLEIGDGESAWCTFTNRYDYRPDIQLVKDSNRTQVLSGGEVVYTYDLTNTGNVDVVPENGNPDSVVTDDKCSPVTRTSGTGTTLAPGDTWQYSCTATGITGGVTNIAQARVVDPNKPNVPLTAKGTQTVTVLNPGFSLTKTSDKAAVYSGGAVTYTYEVANTGQVAIQPQPDRANWVSDDECSPVSYVSGDTNDNGLLDLTETWTYQCATTLTATTENTATLTGVPIVPPSGPTGPEQVGTPIPKTAKHTVSVVRPGIEVVKSVTSPNGVDPGSAAPGVDWAVPAGETVTYSYAVTTGEATTPMLLVSLVDDVCSPLVYQSGDTNADGLIDLDETWIYTCSQQFDGAVTVTNNVVVTGREPKVGGVVTDTDRKTVQSYIANIEVAKSASNAVVGQGTQVTFTYEVGNPGPVPLREVTVVDDKCSPVRYVSGDTGGDGVLYPDETWRYECTQAMSSSEVNVVTATGTTPGKTVPKSNNSTHVEVITPKDAGIRVSKSASATSVAKGTPVTYTYRVTATHVPLAEVKERITDDTCAPVTYVSGDDDGNGLLTSSTYGEHPTEEWIFTCTTTVERTTTNTVTAVGVPTVGGQVVGPPVSGTDTATVRVGTTPATGAGVGPALWLALVALLAGVGLLRVGRP